MSKKPRKKHVKHTPPPINQERAKKLVTPKQLGMTDEELKVICSEPKFNTNETLPWNDLYGFAYVLKNYAKFPGPIDGVIPHGVYSPRAGVSGMDGGQPTANVYNWLSYYDDLFKNQAKYNVIPIACPFYYAMEILQFDPGYEGHGTIFIPYHSTDIWDFDLDWYQMAHDLAKSDLPKPISVLLFFEDYNKGRHKHFRKVGIPVYSCGDKFNQEFLFQFISIVRKYEYVAINDISSPAFYSAAMGRKIITWPSSDGVRYKDGVVPWGDGRPFPDQLYDTFKEPCIEQEWASRVILRKEAFQTPEEMHSMFANKKLAPFL